jgi:PKD repeat protein
MKRILYLTFILPFFIASCELIPEAGFYVDVIEPEVGQEVYFTNDSYNAARYEWDFGDGSFSDVENPVHVYNGTGTYQVKLTAYSRSGLSDEAFQTITVMIPTLLEIEVLEYFDKYPVENASVVLYPTLSDWDAERNSITEGFTDQEGIVVFSGLDAFVYYLDVWEQNHNNYALRDEDVNFIRTPQVKLHQINRFTAYVDYTGGKGAGSVIRDRKVVIKSLVPRVYVPAPLGEK